MIAFGLPVGFGLALLLIWFFFRKGGYKRRPLDAPPGPDWRFTGERFLDPPSGEMVEVWSCPRTGERAYVRARESEGQNPIYGRGRIGRNPVHQPARCNGK